MAAKKVLQPTPVITGRANTLVARLQKNRTEAQIYCGSDITKHWRYIDFYNPQQGLPSIALEWFFGARGLLAGRIMRLQAGYGKGKSSFMWLMYAAAQRLARAWCYHVESEAAPPPPDFIGSFGCDPADLTIAQPRSLEECLEGLDEMIVEIRGGRGGSIDPTTGRVKKTTFTDPLDPAMESPIVCGIDSFSALGLQTRVDQDVLDQEQTPQLAEHSRKMSKYLQDRCQVFMGAQALMMIAAQEKAFIQTGKKKGFGGQDKTSIGDAPIGFHSTYSVDLTAYTERDKVGTDIGERVALWTSKNKLSPKHRNLDIYLVRDHGFDLIKTDMEFLTKHAASPFTADDLYRHSKGVTCKSLGFKSGTEEEFLRTLYGNKDVLMAIREKMRIRGFGFNFEQKYVPTPEEIDDNLNSPSKESDLHGLEGSETAVSEETNAQ
jgi:hypothetical protein